ncbi:MAG: heavy metal-binding domain-containing protein [Alphaproteobacteria bacterium]|nr:MAG: heavy metal-binding domain-containing protein [Alphaproteobacteria bacterium]
MLESGLVILSIIFIAVWARHLERQHYVDIQTREILYANIPVMTTSLKKQRVFVSRTKLVISSISIADDLFKYVLSILRGMFGGRVASYELILDRARRESILRLKEQCPDADALINVHFCTSKVGRRIVEIVTYGTAVYWQEKGAHGDHL